jgi:hypothetical protein
MAKSEASSQGKTGHSPTNAARPLGGIDFPANKQDLARHGQGNGAGEEVMDVLNAEAGPRVRQHGRRHEGFRSSRIENSPPTPDWP